MPGAALCISLRCTFFFLHSSHSPLAEAGPPHAHLRRSKAPPRAVAGVGLVVDNFVLFTPFTPKKDTWSALSVRSRKCCLPGRAKHASSTVTSGSTLRDPV